jgi:murein DD-endopeptidase MepM/ murein hydrolase activator NlpD
MAGGPKSSDLLSKVWLLGAVICSAILAGCGGGDAASSTSMEATETCTGYVDWQTSAYVLPYPVGAAYKVIQGNCSPPGNGHRGVNRYAYDFDMAIGTQFSAARSGVVVEVEQTHFDGQVAATGFDNYIVIRHSDGTAGLYGHITHNGSLVGIGDSVIPGMPIGLSGNTGNTANIPHLHFATHQCDPVTGGSDACPTLPVTFRNTDVNPNGLQVGQTYPAKPFN